MLRIPLKYKLRNALVKLQAHCAWLFCKRKWFNFYKKLVKKYSLQLKSFKISRNIWLKSSKSYEHGESKLNSRNIACKNQCNEGE